MTDTDLFEATHPCILTYTVILSFHPAALAAVFKKKKRLFKHLSAD